MPTLNDTVRRLSHLDCEFCISDGGSIDGTTAALESSPNARIIRSSPDEGIYDAWNKVLPYCRGEYLAFIGVDDKPIEEFLIKARKVFSNARRTPLLIYGDRYLQKGRYRRKVISPREPRLFKDNHPIFDIPHQGALNHRSVFEKRVFDKRFRLAGDVDFYISLRDVFRQEGYVYIPTPQIIANADGVSRAANSYAVYLHEYTTIEDIHGLRLGYPKKCLWLLSQLRHTPHLFSLIKEISWMIRHDR